MGARHARAGTEPLPPVHRSGLDSITLLVIEGPDAGAEFVVEPPSARVGRHEDNDIVLTDASVSGSHCELVLRGGRVRVRDVDSRNGIYVNGTRIYDSELTDGCILALGNTQLRCELRRRGTDPGLDEGDIRIGDLVARSPVMRQVVGLLDSASRSDVTVLLVGETGTGKSAAAEYIHQASRRASGPFVTVDCGAISLALLESELFGHTRGAFTGATTDRPGAFETASGGTLFLDEIGDLPLEVQPVLLRVLETRRVRRVGSNDEIPVDVRLIAATNRHLRAAVDERRFRSDLFYRLAVLEVDLPALSERPEDVPLIVEELVRRALVTQRGTEALAVATQLTSPAMAAAMQGRTWPGNVRELRNYVQRCFALGELVPLDEPM